MSVENLERELGTEWKAVNDAGKFSEAVRKELSSAISEGNDRLESTDTSLVALGSLARKECVLGSDLDWIVLIDAQADPYHLALTQEIRKKIESVIKELGLAEPSPRGAFGNMVFSHDIIHSIGGEDDTNHNTTIRILLLLESVAIGRSDARNRVLTNILRRYLEEDAFFASGKPKSRAVPRFLLNDIIRYWRIIAVDFASKRRELEGEGWALRNIKLRMSRKLMFMAGVIMCFDCELKHREIFEKALFAGASNAHSLIQLLLTEYVDQTPLDVCARAFLDFGKLDTARDFFDAYDEFLSKLANKEIRDQLKALNYETAAENQEFQSLRTTSHKFQEAALKFFFEDNEEVRKLTQQYGIF
jgi:hypothetical protein